MIITIKDESFTGEVLNQMELSFPSSSASIRDIITQRVMQEVEIYNNKLPEYFLGLVKPNEAEKTLNGYKLKSRKPIDGEKQAYIALDAFQKNGFFVLVDDLQCESLEQQVSLSENTHISFIKLTPLVGG